MNQLTVSIILSFCILVASCRKKLHDVPSHEKEITSFLVYVSPTERIQGTIRNDSILVQVPPVVSLDSVYVSVKIIGIGFSPAPGEIINFNHPVIYTVTAEDGSTRLYTVIVSYLNAEKEITAFVFKAAENTGLKEDLTSTIEDSTIVVLLSSDADITKLKPAITFKGKSISPENGAITDFSNGASYTITAEDHTTKTYSVVISYNKYVYISSTDGYVYALHGATGKVKWKYNTVFPPSDPIYKDGVLYVGSSDGIFYALDGETGALKWKFFNQKARFSVPHVAEGVIYVTFFTASVYSTGVFAIDARSGSLLWKTLSPFAGYGVASGPTYSDGMVYVSVYDAGLMALDAATGAIKWRNMVGLVIGNPAVVNGTVYLGDESSLIEAFDARTGALKWSFDGGANNRSSPTVVNGVVYTAGERGYVYAIDANKGSLIWKTEASVVEGPVGIEYDESGIREFASPVISGGLMFIGDYVSNIYVFDASTGTEKWNYNNNDGKIKKCQPGPVAAHGMVVTDRCDNMLKAFYAATGKPMWTFTAGGAVNTHPCLVDFGGNAFYSSASGNVN